MTDAVHAVVPPRWSETVTGPREPDIVLDEVEATCDPSETPVVGALIESVPDVNVKEAGVEALAGRPMPMLKALSPTTGRTNLRTISLPHLSHRERSQEMAPLSRLSSLESELNPIDLLVMTCYSVTGVSKHVFIKWS